LLASACGIVKISWKARTSSGATIPSALAIFADSAITATENATLRRVSGSPANTVRTASTTPEKAVEAVSPMASNRRLNKDMDLL
jgi:hypothetical protein